MKRLLHLNVFNRAHSDLYSVGLSKHRPMGPLINYNFPLTIKAIFVKTIQNYLLKRA